MLNYDRLEMSDLFIPGGMCFLARYDCRHAGSAYIRQNLRVHVYMDPKRSSVPWRNPNEFYLSDELWVNYEKLQEQQRQNAQRNGHTQMEKRTRNAEHMTMMRKMKKEKREEVKEGEAVSCSIQ